MTLLEELLAYSNDVLSCKIVACQKHKWSCLRFLNDVTKADTNDFPYVFNSEKADKFLSWMRLFKHRKGVLKGRNIEPHIIQKFVFGNIYGWYHSDTGYRRFNKFFWQVARKNAKTQSLACVGLYETMVIPDGIEVCETYSAATKRDQAKIVWDEAVGMLDNCELLKDKFKVAYSKITHLKSGSIMRALSEEDRKSGDGLSPQCGIIDEYHAHETSEIYDIIETGMGARQQPLLGIITTAGFELNNPCYNIEYRLISKILNPDIPVNLENYFVMVNELDKNETADDIEIDGKIIAPGELIDDIKDERIWEKANPIVCSYKEGRDFLRKQLEEALEAPEKMRNFLTKHMNIWVSMRENGYMNMQKWAACEGEIPDLTSKQCFVGLDLSAKLDLTSVTFEFPIDDVYIIFSHSFMPKETFEQKRKTDKVPYDLWVAQGWITLTEGPIVDYHAVKDYVIKLAQEKNWYINEICLDPWGALQISSDFAENGYTVVEIIQGIKTLSEPTKHFREMVYAKKVIHDGNPVLTWAISNAVCEEVDRNKNIILSKKKSVERIDPIAATINAHVRSMVVSTAEPVVLFI
jgi:phage terminase large subunit-like protein